MIYKNTFQYTNILSSKRMFRCTPRRSTINPAITLTDPDYAVDIYLISDRVEKAQELLKTVWKRNVQGLGSG